ncbi:hypothetical protein Micbo1qcDRAFT_166375 [Microdochium bolleyi]|uniref:Uncharacterized protein n=1 Tax=Microdochium bolleyi TaxID=196109 RepID=A0A136IVN2_9PEZI|nr:hypothetical protein Micbo1qcDRAFT_166375 [Microdochium bolleyi]
MLYIYCVDAAQAPGLQRNEMSAMLHVMVQRLSSTANLRSGGVRYSIHNRVTFPAPELRDFFHGLARRSNTDHSGAVPSLFFSFL